MMTHRLHTSHYRWPVILATALHLVLLLLLVCGIFFYQPSQYSPEQKSIQATLISSSELAVMAKQAKAVSQPPPKPVETRSVPQTTPVKVLAKPQPKPQPTPKAIQAKPVSNKQAQQKNLEEALMQEEMQTSKASPTKPAKPTATQSMQEALMEQQLQAETGQLKQAAARSKATQGEVDKYKALILQQIQQNWIMPKNVQHLSCLLQVQVAPGGMVLNVSVLKSSGNAALDRSAIAAVNKSSPLPVPKDSAAFGAFRTFTLTVKPEGSELSED